MPIIENDPEAIENTVIALDVVMTALLGSMADRHPEVAADLQQALALAYRRFRDQHPHMRYSAEYIAAYKEMLSTPPSDPGAT